MRDATRRAAAAVLRLGRLRVSVPLAGLREIAAGAFAQRLLRVPFHPRALDLVAARMRQPAAPWIVDGGVSPR